MIISKDVLCALCSKDIIYTKMESAFIERATEQVFTRPMGPTFQRHHHERRDAGESSFMITNRERALSSSSSSTNESFIKSK